MADSVERGWTFEELDAEEAKMSAYEQLLMAKEAEEEEWVDAVSDGLVETSDRTSFGHSAGAAADGADDLAAGAEGDEAAAADARARARAAHGGGAPALKLWRAALAPHGLTVVDTGGCLGRSLRTTRAFAPGDVLLRAAPAAMAIDAECADAVCHVCLSAPAAGKPLRRCSGCRLAHYCCEAHQRFGWARLGHAAECRLLQTSAPRQPTRSMRLAAIAAHAALKPAPGPAGWALSGGALLSLAPRDGAADGSDADVAAVALLTARLLHASELAPPPKPDLLGALLARLRCNAHGLADGELQPLGGGLFPLAALANHACEPSATYGVELQVLPAEAGARTPGGRWPCLVLRALRPLERGSEVCIAYVDLAGSCAERRQALRRGYGFTCRCERCAAQARPGSAGWRHEAALGGGRCPRCCEPARLVRAPAGGAGGVGLVCARGCAVDAGEAAALAAQLASARAALALPPNGGAGGPMADGAYAALSAAVDEWAPKLSATSCALYRARAALASAAIERQLWADALVHALASEAACALACGDPSAPLGLLRFRAAKLLALGGRADEARQAAAGALSVLARTHGPAHALCAELADTYNLPLSCARAE